ncbi:hypothetical protein ACS0TY_026855 [Phlomoides rotata]
MTEEEEVEKQHLQSMKTATLTLFLLLLSSLEQNAQSCTQIERHSLLSFHNSITSSPPLNWTLSTDCCQWEGISCTTPDNHITHLWLPEKHLSGTINLSNLPFLSHINLSHNYFSGPFPFPLLGSLNHLQTLDLSYNHLSGPLDDHPHSPSIRNLNLSSNKFNGTIHPLFLQQAPNLIAFNVSNNTLSGQIPSSICDGSPFIRILDFSVNLFTGNLSIGECRRLEVIRAGSNRLSGRLPDYLYNITTLNQISLPDNDFSGPITNAIVSLSNLTVLELQQNELTGEIPSEIGSLSNLQQLQLHTNSLNGTLPPSLINCTKLTTLLLRNNHLQGEISSIDFSKIRQLQAIDLGNNSFVGEIPSSLCLCRSLTAVRIAYNQLVGEIPPCMASLTSLTHLSLSDNFLSNVVGALKTLRHCDNLAVLFLSRCYHDEMVPDDDDLLHLSGFQNLQILTLGGGGLKGQIPSWISKLRKLKVLNLSFNKVSGRIPTWLGEMPSLFVLNLTKNALTGDLPREIGSMPALIADNTSSDLSSLALPFLFDSLQYNRLFNLPRGLKVGNNSLSGKIPEEIGRLKLLRVLDLSNNNFNGSIPNSLSGLTNLEKMDMSGNHLSGEIPESLTELHFLSSFSVANNDLEGEIPRGGQFETFSAEAFEGNPGLCGYMVRKVCPINESGGVEEEEEESSWRDDIMPFGSGYFVGLVVVAVTVSYKQWW